ncbi:XRE family transcriptional regulator (plasmid) [Aliivibrio salmonicida]|uniref:helix-turn-helix domain-containing protein n=1 Tax=Aliivibrio salmonicida TaxID=40269 RepID=UPI000F6FC7DC|nr:helix-turn-helix transcriptional regulator [Aliivibrio salmonicida]AZL83319.1 XRE family transcriptional regulator [Aliivibrio salmonicida]
MPRSKLLYLSCSLDDLLKEHEISVYKLSQEINVHRGTLSRMKANKAERVNIQDLGAICKYFKIELSELYSLSE